MRVILAPDSFKGSLTSKRAAEIMAEAIKREKPRWETISVPIGDGGEGTAQALVEAMGGEFEECEAVDPLSRPIKASYGVIGGDTAIIELASASGLTLLSGEERDPMLTSTYGTGLMLRAALSRGCERIYLTIGGSATNDGGLGIGRALGLRFFDEIGNEVPTTGAGLELVRKIDASELMPEAMYADFTVLCDVKNPLLGSRGAAAVFAPQKGASPENVKRLEAGMENYVSVLERQCSRELRDIPGSGAAGGAALPLIAFLDARLQSGIEAVLNVMDFDSTIKNADLVITGEGRIDGQSAEGKVISGVGRACEKRGVPCIAICGCAGEGAELIHRSGVGAYVTTVDRIMPEGEALKGAEASLYRAVREAVRLISIGQNIRRG